ncbi:hypothetical protein EDC02_6929 [Micromonospora sp. Llam0]|uniref:hypothetical protein n=1 Tax=Micromonospora sp. Llam0 TaxID=2485143 RepID=UPI000F4A7413|nr:hypothetical protein [Micromonospora sp. Llam0]ROO52004.1 hypothetical protein EDC02_6897 [Micromonospora sp. Llam0]ROO52033.1 hypothetical protein EDC02_6929 [Micromonospora sp. Llam0]
MRRLLSAALAGAAGSSALNIVTYLDMTLRARPASQTPEQTADRLTSTLHVDLGDEQTAANRHAGIGPLLGYAAGIGAAALYALADPARPRWATATAALTATAMIAAATPMTLLKVTDPRTWSTADWVTDLIPHLAYGAVTATTYRALRS